MVEESSENSILYADSDISTSQLFEQLLERRTGATVNLVSTLADLETAMMSPNPPGRIVARGAFFDQNITPVVNFVRRIYGQGLSTIPFTVLLDQPPDESTVESLRLPNVTIGSYPDSLVLFPQP